MPRNQVELLRAACCIAGLNGKVCDNQRVHLQAMAEEAGVGGASLAAMISRAESDADFYREQFQMRQRDPEGAMAQLFKVAIADSDLNQAERVILQHFAEQLGVTPERCDALLTAAEQKVDRTRPTH